MNHGQATARLELFGYGLRVPHYAELAERGTSATLVEAISENFMGRGGLPRRMLERVRRDASLALHGVSLSIGSVDALDWEYVAALAELGRQFDAAWFSDHLCFSSVGQHHAHDLWPLPYTEETIQHVAARAGAVQDALGRRLLLENISSYVEFRANQMPESEFLSEVARRSGVQILLDVNNLVVSAKNHGFSAKTYLEALPLNTIGQIHLAGHSDLGTHAIDDHASAVPPVVWSLYRRAIERFGPIPTIVEWDENIPSLGDLESEAVSAQTLAEEALNATG